MQITSFETAIKNHLDKVAADDPFFNNKYKNPAKSIEECCKYIKSEVQKAFKGKGGVCAVSDEEVFGMAVHYYDEEELVVEAPKGNVKVVPASEVSVSQPKAKKQRKPKANKAEQPALEAEPAVIAETEEFEIEPLQFNIF